MSETDEVLGEGRFLRLRRRGRWEHVERVRASGVVVVAPLTDDGCVLFIEQYRRAIDRRSIELPAGIAGDYADAADEALEAAARRELIEETGYDARHLQWLAESPSSAGLTNEMITYFKATGLSRVADGGGDESENITLHEIALEDCHAWLDAQGAAGKPVASLCYAGLYFLLRPDPTGR